MNASNKPLNSIASLQERRRQHNQKVARSHKDPETRIRELEADVLRLVDQVIEHEDNLLELEDRLVKQEQYLQILISRLQEG